MLETVKRLSKILNCSFQCGYCCCCYDGDDDDDDDDDDYCDRKSGMA